MDDLQKSILLNQLELLCQLKFGVDKFVQQLKRQTNFIEQFYRTIIVDNSQQQRRRRRQWKAEFNKFCNQFDDVLSNRANKPEESEDLDIYDKIWELFLSLDHSESSNSQSNQNSKATNQLVLVCQLKCCMNAAVNQQKLQKEFIEQIQEFRQQQSENVNDDCESILDRLHIDYEQYAKCSHSKEIISDVYAKIRDLFHCFVSPGVGIPEFGPFLRDIVMKSDDDTEEEDVEVLGNDQLIETTNGQEEEEEEAPYIRCGFDGCLFSTNAARSLARHRQLSHRLSVKQSMEDSDLPVQESRNLPPIHKTNSQTLNCKLDGCSFSTLNSGDLIRHQLTHPQQQKRQFEWYDYSSSSDPTKRPRPGRPRRMRCDFPGCSYTTDRLSNLTSHRATHDSEPRLSCDIGDCSYSTKVLRNLERHKLTHDPENRLNCDQEGCNYVTFRPDHLKVHQFKHHPERRFLNKQKQCEAKQNDNDFSSNDSTTITTTAIDPNPQLRCDFGGCSYVTAAGSLADLQLHKLSQHSRPSLKLRANQTGRPLHWKCDQAGCEYITDNADHLKSHQLEHDT